MTPRVSIVIPTYDRAPDLARALASVRAQTMPDWEAIVVDNQSRDGTAEMVDGLGEPRIVLKSIDNGGIIAASRNLGIGVARGDVVAFLDSDDWWTPDKLATALAAHEAGADVTYHDLFLVRRSGQKRPAPSGSVRPVASPVHADLLRGGNALMTSGVTVRTALMRAIGPLREDRDLVGMEDFDGWLRLARHTERFRLLPGTLGHYWAGGGNTTRPERTLRALAAFEAIHGDDPVLDGRTPGWLDYARGRALFRLGDYRGADAALRRLRLRDLPPAMALKTGYMRLRAGAGR